MGDRVKTNRLQEIIMEENERELWVPLRAVDEVIEKCGPWRKSEIMAKAKPMPDMDKLREQVDKWRYHAVYLMGQASRFTADGTVVWDEAMRAESKTLWGVVQELDALIGGKND